MNRKAIITLVAILLLVVVIIFLNRPTVKLIESESYYSDFAIDDQKVNIKCYITLKNTYNVDKAVKLSALFPDDVEIGLLKDSLLYAEDKDIIVLKNSKKSFEVTFIGDFAGVNKKHDRNLPQINITVLD